MRVSRRQIFLWILFARLLLAPCAYAQPQLKKIRMGISTTSIAFLSIYAAQLKGFYRDEGIDLELILMPATLASSAVLTGDIDYNGAVTGVIAAAVQGRPMKVLIFTADRSLQSIISRKEIKEFKDLKGKKIAGSTPGATATILARLAAKHFGLDPDRDIGILTMGGGDSARLAALESGIADATILSVPISIVAIEKGYRELFFLGEIARFPQTGFGTSDKKIKENPDEVLRMVRATLRGLTFTWDESNRDVVLDIIMKQLKIDDRRFAAEVFKAAHPRPHQGRLGAARRHPSPHRPAARKFESDAPGAHRPGGRLQFRGKGAQGVGFGAINIVTELTKEDMAMQDSVSAQSVATSTSPGKQPRFSGFSHLTIPCKDLQQSRRFFTEVLGGEIAHPGPKLEVRIGGTLVTFSPASGGWTARDSEYPHYAFFIEPEDFLPMKERLESYGVPTTEPWTRDHVKALMYFRDPSGNLFEMYCAQGFKGKLRHGARSGGDYEIDFEALNYEWK